MSGKGAHVNSLLGLCTQFIRCILVASKAIQTTANEMIMKQNEVPNLIMSCLNCIRRKKGLYTLALVAERPTITKFYSFFSMHSMRSCPCASVCVRASVYE